MEKSSYKKTLIWLVLIAILIAGGFFVRKMFFAKKEITFITADVVKMDIVESVLASGILKAFKTVEVGAQVSGQLQKLHVNTGDSVEKDQLLAQIDPVLQENSLKEAEAKVESLQAQRRSKQALLKQYEANYRRQKQMLSEDASSLSDLESAQAQLESTSAETASLDAQINSAKIAIDTAKANLGYTKITAPMDGVVLSINTEEGQTVISTQTATTILTLADLETMTVKAKISEADIMRVKPGLTTYFTLLGDSDTRYYSTLRAIEPAPASSSTSSAGSSLSSSSADTGNTAIYYNGLFEVPNPDNRLRVSMTAQVSIVLNEVKDALSIPLSALGERQQDGTYTVMVLKNKAAVERKVKIGINDNVRTEVLDGLKEGDKVILGDSDSAAAAQEADPQTRRRPPRR